MANVHTYVVCNNFFARLGLSAVLEQVGSRYIHLFPQPDKNFCLHVLNNPYPRRVILALFDGEGQDNGALLTSDVLSHILPGVPITVFAEQRVRQAAGLRHISVIPRKAQMLKIVSALATEMRAEPIPSLIAVHSIRGKLALLTRKEMQVLKLWYDGVSLSGIAQMTGRSVKTISSHKRNAMHKLSVNCDQALIYILQEMVQAHTVQKLFAPFPVGGQW